MKHITLMAMMRALAATQVAFVDLDKEMLNGDKRAAIKAHDDLVTCYTELGRAIHKAKAEVWGME